MKKVAIMVPISPNDAFFSQVAAMRLALTKLSWTRWTWELWICTSGHVDPEVLARWHKHLPEVAFTLASTSRFAEEGNWAQSDDQLRCAPRDADVVLALDADVLPVANFESMLDQIHEGQFVAGVIAHFCFPGWPGKTSREKWEMATKTLVTKPLSYDCEYTYVPPTETDENRLTPFYPNFGIVFFPNDLLQRILPTFFRMRHALDDILPNPGFSTQVAMALAVSELDIPWRALPMRYNYPNDDRAAALHPGEVDHALFWHYLRTDKFDRWKIFTTASEYDQFTNMPLEGMHLRFQQAAVQILGKEWPFA